MPRELEEAVGSKIRPRELEVCIVVTWTADGDSRGDARVPTPSARALVAEGSDRPILSSEADRAAFPKGEERSSDQDSARLVLPDFKFRSEEGIGAALVRTVAAAG